jgi:hypothetical protein
MWTRPDARPPRYRRDDQADEETAPVRLVLLAVLTLALTPATDLDADLAGKDAVACFALLAFALLAL